MSPRRQRDIAEESDRAFCLDGQYRISGAVNANIHGLLGAVRPPGHAINRELIKLAAIVLGNCLGPLDRSVNRRGDDTKNSSCETNLRHFLPFETNSFVHFIGAEAKRNNLL